MNSTKIKNSIIILNFVELICIILVLFLAFFFQIVLHELPCPLCFLQRIGFLGAAFGLLLNLHFGLRPQHYAMVLISALLTSFIALRQIALHVIPGTGAYGDPIFGLHFYTWSFIISTLILIVTAFTLGIDIPYKPANPKNITWPVLTDCLTIVIILLIICNLISVTLECGIHQCPDNPVSYHMF